MKALTWYCLVIGTAGGSILGALFNLVLIWSAIGAILGLLIALSIQPRTKH